MTTTAPPSAALAAAELAHWVEASCSRADGLLFTGTARTDLDEIASWQRLGDLVFAGQCRAIVAASNRASKADREFVADEVGLAIGASPTTGSLLTQLAMDAAELPGLLESVEAGLLTERHVRAVVGELRKVALGLEQRAAVVMVMLTRYAGQTPGELVILLRRLVLTVDPAAARRRQELATSERRLRFWADVDGQGVLQARGPLEVIAAVKASLEATVRREVEPCDERSADARLFDTFTDLLTGGADGPGRWEAQVVVPVTTALGGELELAELPGFGPVLPGTAHDLLADCTTVRRVVVDAATGEVLVVDDALRVQPTGTGRANTGRLGALLDRMLTDPVRPCDVSTDDYRPHGRLIRLVEARDSTCTFPGCHRRASRSDKDHRIPWPLGPTDADNLHCLCRHHHRAKHTGFTVTRDSDGTDVWTTRGGHVYRRRPLR